MAKALSALAVKNVQPKIGSADSKYAGQPVRTELPDGVVSGLYLVVQPSGVKSWALRYRHPHTRAPAKKTWRFDLYGLAAVREEAIAALRMVKEGRDPNAPVPVPVPASETTFEAVWERYFREWVLPGQTETTWQKENAQAYEKRLLPLWEGRDVASITRLEVRALLKAITADGSPYMANRIQSMLSRFFGWCLGEVDLVSVSPMVGLKSVPEEKRDRVLTYAELKALWIASDKVGWPWGPVVKLLMLTGQRLSEVTDMRWSEIDFKTRTLALPGTRTKNKRPHDVPLSSMAMEVIKSLPRFADRDTVFLPHPAATLSGSHGKANVSSALARIMHDGEKLRDGCGKKRAIHVANRCPNKLHRVSALRHGRHDRRYAASLRPSICPAQETHN
jgi:integrase